MLEQSLLGKWLRVILTSKAASDAGTEQKGFTY